MTVTPPQRPRMWAVERPACLIPEAEDRPSGTLERKTAATRAALILPPSSRLIPIAADSGMPSMSAPMAMAVAESPCLPPEFLRRAPPLYLPIGEEERHGPDQ